MDRHKYSTVVLVGVMVISLVAFAIGLDGGGTKNSIAKFYSPERVVDSQLFDDGENLTYGGSNVCLAVNGSCGSVASSIFNNITIQCSFYNNSNNSICYTASSNTTIITPAINPLQDNSGNNNTLTNNGAVYNESGWYEFNGSRYVVINSSYVITSNLNNSYSMRIKFKPNNITITGYILKKKSGTRYQIAFKQTILNKTNWELYDGTTFKQGTSFNIPDYTSWNFYVIVFNSTHGCSYLNGNLTSACTSLSPLTNNITSLTSNLMIGSTDAGESYFNGSIDDVRIYNRSLSASEVLALYNNESVDSTGLVAYYNFTNQSGSSTGLYVPEMINVTSSNFHKVSIGGNNNLYPLEVNSQSGGISIYSLGNITATGYITRTSVFDKSKSSFDYIHDSSYYLSSDGSIDHSKFYGYTKIDVVVPNMITSTLVNREVVSCKDVLVNVVDEVAMSKVSVLDLKNPESIVEPIYALDKDGKVVTKVENQCSSSYETVKENVKTVNRTFTFEGVNLEMEINVLRQAVFELNEKVKKLEK